MTRAEVEGLVLRYLELREDGQRVEPEEFAAEHPKLHDELLAALRSTLSVARTLESSRIEAPHRIGPYAVQAEIGRGGMGIVYRVEREGRTYALKVLPMAPAFARASVERFRREARILARLRHPNIVRVHDTGSAEGAPYIVMDLVEGRVLSELRDPMPERGAARLVAVLARALAAAHGEGVLHRDLKPQNVVLRSDGTPVLLDFGLVAADDEPTLTTSGALLGTPRYMAPEQALAEPTDARTDVYGLGLLLYELIVGAPARPEGSRAELIASASRGVVLRPRLRHATRALRRVLDTALARAPRHRYESAEQLADDLERFVEGSPVRARPPGLLARTGDAVRRDPVRAALLGAVAVTSALVARAPFGGESSPSAEETRAALARHLDRAVCAWSGGDDEEARAEIERAAMIDPRQRAPRDLGALLRDEIDLGSAAKAFDRPGLEAVAAALRARALRLAGDEDRARATLEIAWHDHPTSLAVAAELARTAAEQGDSSGAENTYRAALEAAPDAQVLRMDLARLLLARGDTTQGIAIAARSSPAKLAQLLEPIPDHEAVRHALREMLEAEPDDAELWYALAYSLDSDHLLEQAERAYARTIELDPEHVAAHVNLAHLYAGAQLGACAPCDAAYAKAPGMFAPEKALNVVRRALLLDRGRSERVVEQALRTTLDLAKRAPDLGAPGKIVEALDRLLADRSLAPACQTRLGEARLKLRRVLGQD